MKKELTKERLFIRVDELTRIIDTIYYKGNCSIGRLYDLQKQVSHLGYLTRQFEKHPYEFINDIQIVKLQNIYNQLQSKVLADVPIELYEEFREREFFLCTMNSLYHTNT